MQLFPVTLLIMVAEGFSSLLLWRNFNLMRLMGASAISLGCLVGLLNDAHPESRFF